MDIPVHPARPPLKKATIGIPYRLAASNPQTTVHKFLDKFRVWRKKLLDHLPYVKRKRYKRKVLFKNTLKGFNRELRKENTGLAKILIEPAEALAAKAKITQVVAINPAASDELCLFATHAPAPALKQHVIDHVNSLVDEHIAVVLIVNTDHRASEFALPPEFSSRLHGLLVRQNVGFDFAAWAHAFSLLPRGMPGRRLYFVNDSIVGPLDKASYRTMLERIRQSKADMIGLTQNTKPKPHLQSFYLVFNERLFRSPTFTNVMANVFNLPSKNAVIEAYEIELTRHFQAQGFQCEALFPSMARDLRLTDDTIFRWARLVEIGFPFVKSSVLLNRAELENIIRLVPSKYR